MNRKKQKLAIYKNGVANKQNRIEFQVVVALGYPLDYSNRLFRRVAVATQILRFIMSGTLGAASKNRKSARLPPLSHCPIYRLLVFFQPDLIPRTLLVFTPRHVLLCADTVFIFGIALLLLPRLPVLSPKCSRHPEPPATPHVLLGRLRTSSLCRDRRHPPSPAFEATQIGPPSFSLPSSFQQTLRQKSPSPTKTPTTIINVSSLSPQRTP